jgi:hypothetical protein
MTVHQIWEEVKMHFPDTPFNYVLMKANEVQGVFVQETECIKATLSCTASSNQLIVASPYTQTLTSSDSNALTFAFPTRALFISEILFRNSDGEYIDNGLTYKIDLDKLMFGDSEGEMISTFPSDITTIELVCILTPATLTASTDTPSIPSRFHQAITYGILRSMYGIGKTALLQNAGWYRSEYERLRLEARRYANTAGDKTSHVVPVGELLTDVSSQIYVIPEE